MIDLCDAADVMRTAEIASLTTRVRDTALLASRLVHPLWSEGTAEGQILTAGRSPKVDDIEQNPAVALSWVAGTQLLLVGATATVHTGEAVQALHAALGSAPHGYRPENFWSSTDLVRWSSSSCRPPGWNCPCSRRAASSSHDGIGQSDSDEQR